MELRELKLALGCSKQLPGRQNPGPSSRGGSRAPRTGTRIYPAAPPRLARSLPQITSIAGTAALPHNISHAAPRLGLGNEWLAVCSSRQLQLDCTCKSCGMGQLGERSSIRLTPPTTNSATSARSSSPVPAEMTASSGLRFGNGRTQNAASRIRLVWEA